MCAHLFWYHIYFLLQNIYLNIPTESNVQKQCRVINVLHQQPVTSLLNYLWTKTNENRVKMTPTIRAANMAKAVVKSFQEMGNLALRVVNSRNSMRRVMQKQKHHVNMHQVQKESVLWLTDATRLKEIQVKITCSIRTMPTGTVSVPKSSVTMVAVTLWSVYCGSR